MKSFILLWQMKQSKRNIVRIEKLYDYRLGKYQFTNQVSLELWGSNTKGTEVLVKAQLPVYWFDSIARSMWEILNQKQREIDELKTAMKNQQP